MLREIQLGPYLGTLPTKILPGALALATTKCATRLVFDEKVQFRKVISLQVTGNFIVKFER